MLKPGRFGPSRKKEAAARRVGCSERWVFQAAWVQASAETGTSCDLRGGTRPQTGVSGGRLHSIRRPQVAHKAVRFSV
jgi:hypothetical protein